MAAAADPAHARPIFPLRRRDHRQEAAGERPSSAPASASAPSPALYLPSPSPKQFMSRSRSLLRLPLYPSFLVKCAQRRNGEKNKINWIPDEYYAP